MKKGKEKELYVLLYEYLKRSKLKHNLPVFDKWYQWITNQEESMQAKRMQRKPKYAVVDYSEVVLDDIDMCIISFKAEAYYKKVKEGKIKSKRVNLNEIKNPSLQQFKEYFRKYLKGEAHSWTRVLYLTCFVRIIQEDPEVLIKQFKELIRKKKKEPIIKSVDSSFKLLNYKHVRTDELRTYLEVYDLAMKHGYNPTNTKKGNKELQRIIEAHNKNEDSSLESTQRKYRIYLANAKKIISNLEKPSPKFPEY